MAESDRSSETGEEPATRNPGSPEIAWLLEQLPLWLLLAAHLILGPFFCIWSAVEITVPFVFEYVLVVPAFGFTLAQASLLGFWVAFSLAAWWIRSACLIVGIVYLQFILHIGLQTDEYALLPSMAAVGSTVVFGVSHWRHVGLRRFLQKAHQVNQDAIKLSIRGLMLLTFIVAITIIGVRQLPERVPGSPNLLGIVLLSLCSIVIGVASAWAGLGVARPVLRSIVVLLMSGVLGALFVYSVGEESGDMYFYITSMMVLQAAIFVASVLVVRSCGYRLVRQSATPVEAQGPPE